jgi:MFS family permease
MSPSDASAPVIDTKLLRRVSAGALIGTAVEWYDYFIYGLLAALVFNELFFPSLDPVVGTVVSLLTFAVGFVVRPIGSIIFGHLGDRYGRRNMLVATVTIMGLSSGAIGLLPTYHMIGIWAPLLLLLCRIIEGLSVGGEWGGAVLLAVEYAPPKKRAFYGAMPQYGSPVGNIGSSVALALALVLFLPHDQFIAWGWRLPFLLSFILMGIALYIRNKIDETPEFKQLIEQDKEVRFPLMNVVRDSWRRMLIAICASFVGSAPFYLLTTFIVKYGTSSLDLPTNIMLTGTTLGAVLEGVGIFVGGYLGDRYTHWKVVAAAGLLSVLTAFPLMTLVATGQPAFVIIGIAIGIGLLGLSYGPLGPMVSNMFGTDSRYSAVAVSYNLSGAIGGFMPSIALAATSTFASTHWIIGALLALSMLVVAIGGLLGGVAARKDKGMQGKEAEAA